MYCNIKRILIELKFLIPKISRSYFSTFAKKIIIMKREIIFASLMVKYAYEHGFSVLEIQEYFVSQSAAMNIDWDDSCNEGLDVIDALYSHLMNLGKYDYSKYPFV